MQSSPIPAVVQDQGAITALLQVERKIPEEAVPEVYGCHTRGSHMQASPRRVVKECQAEEDMGPGVSKDKDHAEVLWGVLEVGKV